MASDFYNSIKKLYDAGTYTKEQVAAFVTSKKIHITKAEYKKITGDVYKAPVKEEEIVHAE